MSYFFSQFQLHLPLNSPLPGSELTKEPFRWDQRLFALVLRLPGLMPLETEQLGSVPSDESAITPMCEVTGGEIIVQLKFEWTISPFKINCLNSICFPIISHDRITAPLHIIQIFMYFVHLSFCTMTFMSVRIMHGVGLYWMQDRIAARPVYFMNCKMKCNQVEEIHSLDMHKFICVLLIFYKKKE